VYKNVPSLYLSYDGNGRTGRILNVLYLVKEGLLDVPVRCPPYTKIEFVERDLGVSRITATKYLDTLDAGGFVKKQKIGRSNYSSIWR